MLYSSMLPSVKTIADESGRVHAEVDMPSRSMRWSVWRPPWIASVMKLCPELPPTSWLTGEPTTWPPVTPGMSTPRFWNERPVGTLSMTSRVIDDLLLGVLEVDDRRLAGNGDRLRHAADLQLGVDRGGEPGGELDALAPDDAEALEREGHRIGARAQLDDLVSPLAVGLGDPDLFDQRRTAGLDRHARQDGSRRIANDPCNAAGGCLRQALGGRPQQHRDDDDPRATSWHRILPGVARDRDA